LPTALPRPRRVEAKKKPSFFTLLLNTFMIASAVLLTFMVLVREEQYALAQTNSLPAVISTMPQATPDMTGQTMAMPPE
jgi:hypothetical protein